jgi:3-phenylpropionate/trans-cinnamate dioxygenase ferredoxin subunit
MPEAVRETGTASDGAKKYIVARTADIPEGERLIVEVGGREIGVFKLDGEFYALLHRCPHLGGPLCNGEILGFFSADRPGEIEYDPDEKYLICPWHGWEFDIRTGQSWWDPVRTRARRIPVAVEGGRMVAESLDAGAAERAAGPYVAETYPVEVEESYVVVTIRHPVAGPRD